MTCIVGVVENGEVWIGGDSLGTKGGIMVRRLEPKVFRRGEFVIGVCGSFRLAQILAHVFQPPHHEPGLDPLAYMVRHFVDAVRQCLNDGGYFERTSGEVVTGSEYLVGYCGRLFMVSSDDQVGEYRAGYMATGSGMTFALGAMHAAQSLTPEARILTALEAAEHFDNCVLGPFTILRAGPPVGVGADA